VNSGITSTQIHRVWADPELTNPGKPSSNSTHQLTDDLLAVEEPLEIRIGFELTPGNRTHKSISITMRTPGNDFELAAGFLFTEGILHNPEQIEEIRHCGKSLSPYENTLRVELKAGVEIDFKRLERNFYTSSSCGVCGKSSLAALRTQRPSFQQTPSLLKVSSRTLYTLPKTLRSAQANFDATGGLHASALFSSTGELLLLREDVGRHNALDKVIGKSFQERRLPLQEAILLVSGRASFELLQKASMAGIPILAAVGAPSSLALECAKEFGITLVGFLRGERFNIYSGSERITYD
jgi:FdhD protein